MSSLEDAVYSRLPAGARTRPALTWNDAGAESTGGADDLGDDERLLLAAACAGTGTVTVTVSGRPDTVLDCAGGRSVGPIDLTPVGDPPGAVEFDVRRTAGTPRFFATAVSLRPSPTATP